MGERIVAEIDVDDRDPDLFERALVARFLDRGLGLEVEEDRVRWQRRRLLDGEGPVLPATEGGDRVDLGEVLPIVGAGVGTGFPQIVPPTHHARERVLLVEHGGEEGLPPFARDHLPHRDIDYDLATGDVDDRPFRRSG